MPYSRIDTTTLLQKLATFNMRNVKNRMIEWTKIHFTVAMVNIGQQVS